MLLARIAKQRWAWGLAGIAIGLVIATVIPVPAQGGEPADVGVRVAACGVEILSGQTNHCDGTTVLRSEAGTPLSLEAAPGSPPLVVNNSTRVLDLNADRVDGYDAADLLTKEGYDPDGDGVVKDSKRFSGRKPFFYMAKSTYDKNRNGIVDRAETVTPASPLYIPAAAFNLGGELGGMFVSGVIYTDGGKGWRAYAPVTLPDGAVMDTLTVFLDDNDGGSDLKANLIRREMASGDCLTLAEVETSGASSSTQALTDPVSAEGATVDNATYTLFLQVYVNTGIPDASLKLHGAEVSFTP